MAGTIIGGIIAIAATAVSTSVSASQSGKARKQASSQFEQQKQKQDKLEADQKARIAGEESAQKSLDTRNAARNRQGNLAAGAGGRRDTILTGPLGVTGNPSGEQKTLLGA